jgi:glutaredoxin-related protein
MCISRALFVFSLVFAEECHGAFFVSSPLAAKTTVKRSPTLPPVVALFQATESETQDKKEATLVTTKTSSEEAMLPFVDSIQQGLQTSLRILRESHAGGYGIKQIMANILAGDYDETEINAKIDAYIQNSPCVMFTWQRSPSCVQATEAFASIGILNQVQIVRLDDPWNEGNPVRAQIGKRVGRSSVPMIFIGGEYVGGFDGGPVVLESSRLLAYGTTTRIFFFDEETHYVEI